MAFMTDLVAVYTKDYTRVFPNARPLKAIVKEDAQLMEHPIENGSEVTDHRIIKQVELEISMILQAPDYKNTYAQIKQTFINSTFLIVQTKATVYTNQIIQGLPHEEDPGRFDTLTVSLKLKEVLIAVTSSTIAPRNPTSVSTVNRGTIQAGSTTTKRSQSTLAALADKANVLPQNEG